MATFKWTEEDLLNISSVDAAANALRHANSKSKAAAAVSIAQKRLTELAEEIAARPDPEADPEST